MDKIKKGDILAEIHSSSEERLKNAENILKSCIKISENPLKSKKTILKIIGG